MPNLLSYKQELYRKYVHISSSIIPILLLILGKDTFLPLILITSLLFLMFDLARKHNKFLKIIFYKLFGTMARPHEATYLTGASWVFISAVICIIIFNEKVAFIALLIVSLSDSSAAIIGIKYGKTKLLKKSLEGSIAFLITTFFIIYTFSNTSFVTILCASLVITISELISSIKFNDNLIVPITAAILLTLAGVK